MKIRMQPLVRLDGTINRRKHTRRFFREQQRSKINFCSCANFHFKSVWLKKYNNVVFVINKQIVLNFLKNYFKYCIIFFTRTSIYAFWIRYLVWCLWLMSHASLHTENHRFYISSIYRRHIARWNLSKQMTLLFYGISIFFSPQWIYR